MTDLLMQIEDYEPKHSLVVTPNKMVKYYEDVKLSHEIYPWSSTSQFTNPHPSSLTYFL